MESWVCSRQSCEGSTKELSVITWGGGGLPGTRLARYFCIDYPDCHPRFTLP